MKNKILNSNKISAISYFFSILILTVACQSPIEKSESKEESEIIIDKLDSPVHNSLRGISVLSDEIAWLSGAKGSIIRTINAGQYWEIIPAPDSDLLDYRDIQAFSSEVAIVVSAGFPSRIYKTTDAGIHWKLVHENKDSASFMNSIAFKNELEGIVFGDVLGGRHLILKTKDAGETWSRIDDANIPKPLEIENGFAASGSCIAIDNAGNYFIALGGEKVRIFTSSDGEKWSVTKTPMYAGSASKGAYSITYGKGKLIAVGGDYLEADSTRLPILSIDGHLWTVSKMPVSGYRSVVDYSEKGNFWLAGGTNGIDLSRDGGDTWEKISDENINTLQFAPNSTKAFLGTKNGAVFLIDITVN